MSKKEQTILQVWSLAEVPLNVPPKTQPTSTTNDDLICGVELEIENLQNGFSRYMELAGDAWTVVEDGSLRPRGLSWEFVSKPMALKYLIPQVEKLFKAIDVKEAANYSDRCSVHVHTNVQDFTQEQLSSLALVYPVFEDVLFRYVNHYKKKEEQGYCRDTNLYCIPWSACKMNRKFVDRYFDNAAHTQINWQKYTALNLLPISEKGTVEWRHMHGTCDMEKLSTWLNVIGAIMRYTKSRPFEEVMKVIKVMNDVSTYQQFFDEVMQGALPYNDEYRALLREGIVNAKYSLINYEANKDKPKKKTSKSIYDEPAVFRGWLDEFVEDNAAALGTPVAPAGAAGTIQQRDDLLNTYAPVNWGAVSAAAAAVQHVQQQNDGLARLEQRLIAEARARNPATRIVNRNRT